MNSPTQYQLVSRHVDEPAQRPYADALDRYLSERGYARNTARAYVGYASRRAQGGDKQSHAATVNVAACDIKAGSASRRCQSSNSSQLHKLVTRTCVEATRSTQARRSDLGMGRYIAAPLLRGVAGAIVGQIVGQSAIVGQRLLANLLFFLASPGGVGSIPTIVARSLAKIA